MKFGLCKSFTNENGQFSIDELDKIKECGFDYIEMNLTNISLLSDEEFEKLSKYLKTIDIPVLATNCLLPGNITLVGEKRDFEKFKFYIDMALSRANILDIHKVVFGSGGSRNVPSGFDRDLAMAQFSECCDYVATIAKKYSIIVCLEALNLQETNLITSIEEGLTFAKKKNLSSLKTVLDFFHFNLGRENYDILKGNADYISHVHYARVLGRTFLNYADFENEIPAFTALKNLGYDDTFSFECSVPGLSSDTAEYKKTLDLFKTFFSL